MKAAPRISLDELAARLDVSARTIMRWLRAPSPVPHQKAKGKNGKLTFDEAEVRAWQERAGRSGERGRPTSVARALSEAIEAAPSAPDVAAAARALEAVDLGEAGRQLMAAFEADDRSALLRLAPSADPRVVKKLEAMARARVALAEAVRRELDNQARRRELLPTSEVVAALTRAVEDAKAAFEVMAPKLTPRLVNQPYDVIYTAIEEEVRATLTALAAAAKAMTE